MPVTVKNVDRTLGEQRFRQFANQLRSIDIHADPTKSAFNQKAPKAQKKEYIWCQLAAAGTELKLAWNLVRLAAPSAARRSARVALEHLSMGVLEGIPISTVRENWENLPKKKVPLWQMSLPRILFDENGPDAPMISASSFPHILQAVLPAFPGWTEEMARQFREYIKKNLHPFAHGSADGMAYLLSSTTLKNPIMGNVFDAKHPEIYTSLADELIRLAASFHAILHHASMYLNDLNSS